MYTLCPVPCYLLALCSNNTLHHLSTNIHSHPHSERKKISKQFVNSSENSWTKLSAAGIENQLKTVVRKLLFNFKVKLSLYRNLISEKRQFCSFNQNRSQQQLIEKDLNVLEAAFSFQAKTWLKHSGCISSLFLKSDLTLKTAVKLLLSSLLL